jgi:hypothetical protein
MRDRKSTPFQGVEMMYDCVRFIVGVLTLFEVRKKIQARSKNPDVLSFVEAVVVYFTFLRGQSVVEPLWERNRSKLGRILMSLARRATICQENSERLAEEVKKLSSDPLLLDFFNEVVTYLTCFQCGSLPRRRDTPDTILPLALVEARRKSDAGRPPIPMDHVGVVDWMYDYMGDGGGD